MKFGKKVAISLCLLVLESALLYSVLSAYPYPSGPSGQGEDDEEVKGEDVSVTASIRLEEITFVVHPEKRIPRTNNWDSFIDFEVWNPTTNTMRIRRLSRGTDDLGYNTFSVNRDESLATGTYQVRVKGISHLSKIYNSVYFSKITETIDLTLYDDLLAGDTHVSRDDFINSLDLSILLINLGTGDYINDLNQDSQVNSLDLSNMVYNLGKSGDVLGI